MVIDYKDCSEVQNVIDQCQKSNAGKYFKLPIQEEFQDLVSIGLNEKDELWLGFKNEIKIY